MFQFNNRTALITGGTSGIGRAIAEAFLASGANVIAAGLPAAPGILAGIRIEHLDVTDSEAVKSLLATIPDLDILVNAAGVIRRDEEFQIEVFQQVLSINLIGVMRMCSEARSRLARSRGCIVNVASMLSFFGGARVPAYSASKG